MQPTIYLILYLCYENIAESNGRELVVANHIFETDLMDLRIPYRENDSLLESLQEKKSYKIKRLSQKQTQRIQDKNVNEINELLEYLITKKQRELMSNIQYYEIYLQKNISKLQNLVKDYSSHLKRYFNKTFNKDDVINDIDKQLVILDLIETSNKVLFKIERNLIRNMTDNRNVSNTANSILMRQYYKLLDDLKQEVTNKKKGELKYICDQFNICRMYPSYSDYISDLLCVILDFTDIRFEYILSQVIVLIKEQINFFREILGEELTNDLGDRFYPLFSVDVDKTDLRQPISLLNKLLEQRHKFSKRKNHPRSVKAKAIRILIDIIDKMFEKEDDEILLMYISVTKKGLLDWSNMKNNDISTVLGNFIRYTVNNLKYNLTFDTKNEIRTLVEVLMKTKVNKEDVFEYLFSKGSQYVNRQSNTDLLLDII